METQVVVKHYLEGVGYNYKVWGYGLAKNWNLNIVFKGTYDECLAEQKRLTELLNNK